MWNLIFHKTTGIESQNSKKKEKEKMEYDVIFCSYDPNV